MQSSIKIACFAAALFAGSSTLALAQGGSTDARATLWDRNMSATACRRPVAPCKTGPL